MPMKSVLLSTSVTTSVAIGLGLPLRAVMSRTILDAPTTVPVIVLDRRDRQRDQDPAAVAAARAPSRSARSAGPAFRRRDDLVFLGDALGRDDQGDVPADGLRGGVAEQPLGAGVPALNDAVQRLADDGVVGRLDDRREQAGRQQLSSPSPCRPPLRGDVAEDQHAAETLPSSSGSARRCRRSAARRPCAISTV